jgi:hydrogenase maturation factor
VDTSLLGVVGANDLVLVHAGAAITRLEEASR